MAVGGWNAGIYQEAIPWEVLRRTAVTVTTSETALPTTALSNRKVLWLFNAGTANIFLGPTGVQTSSELYIQPRQILVIPVSDLVTLYGIVSTGSVVLVVWEAK